MRRSLVLPWFFILSHEPGQCQDVEPFSADKLDLQRKKQLVHTYERLSEIAQIEHPNSKKAKNDNAELHKLREEIREEEDPSTNKVVLPDSFHGKITILSKHMSPKTKRLVVAYKQLIKIAEIQKQYNLLKRYKAKVSKLQHGGAPTLSPFDHFLLKTRSSTPPTPVPTNPKQCDCNTRNSAKGRGAWCSRWNQADDHWCYVGKGCSTQRVRSFEPNRKVKHWHADKNAFEMSTSYARGDYERIEAQAKGLRPIICNRTYLGRTLLDGHVLDQRHWWDRFGSEVALTRVMAAVVATSKRIRRGCRCIGADGGSEDAYCSNWGQMDINRPSSKPWCYVSAQTCVTAQPSRAHSLEPKSWSFCGLEEACVCRLEEGMGALGGTCKQWPWSPVEADVPPAAFGSNRNSANARERGGKGKPWCFVSALCPTATQEKGGSNKRHWSYCQSRNTAVGAAGRKDVPAQHQPQSSEGSTTASGVTGTDAVLHNDHGTTDDDTSSGANTNTGQYTERKLLFSCNRKTYKCELSATGSGGTRSGCEHDCTV
jgi:hypothetical protein